MLNFCQTWGKAWFCHFLNVNMFILSYTPPGSLSWHSLVPVVVYSDWTMWLPCGCQAAPLLWGNCCLWYCRVAAEPWVTDLATCPALAAIAVRRRRRGGGGTGLVGAEGSTCHVGRGGAPVKYVMADHEADSTGSGWWHLFAFHLFRLQVSADHENSLQRETATAVKW